MINFFFNTDPWSIGPVVFGGVITAAIVVGVVVLVQIGVLK